jgi:hypothetical protein
MAATPTATTRFGAETEDDGAVSEQQQQGNTADGGDRQEANNLNSTGSKLLGTLGGEQQQQFEFKFYGSNNSNTTRSFYRDYLRRSSRADIEQPTNDYATPGRHSVSKIGRGYFSTASVNGKLNRNTVWQGTSNSTPVETEGGSATLEQQQQQHKTIGDGGGSNSDEEPIRTKWTVPSSRKGDPPHPPPARPDLASRDAEIAPRLLPEARLGEGNGEQIALHHNHIIESPVK